MITNLLGLLLASAVSPSVAASQFLKRAEGQAVGRVTARQATGGGLLLRASNALPMSAAARTLQTLDTNQDGLVEPSEVRAFAQLQGLDVAAATKEYAGVDLNGDGNLDANELALALSETAASPSEVTAAPKVRLQQAPVQPQQVPVQRKAVTADQPVTAPSLYTASAGAAKASSLAAAVASTAPAEAVPAAPAAPAAALEASQEVTSASDTRANAASEIVKQIALEERYTKEAQALEHNAAQVRSNATLLAQTYAARAAKESTNAASAKAKEILAQIADLENKARLAEVEAAKLRAGMKADLLEADEQMSVATSAYSLTSASENHTLT